MDATLATKPEFWVAQEKMVVGRNFEPCNKLLINNFPVNGHT